MCLYLCRKCLQIWPTSFHFRFLILSTYQEVKFSAHSQCVRPHLLPAACVIAHQYPSVALGSLSSHSRKERFSARFNTALLQKIFASHKLRMYEIAQGRQCLFRERLLLLGAESFVFQVAIQKLIDYFEGSHHVVYRFNTYLLYIKYNIHDRQNTTLGKDVVHSYVFRLIKSSSGCKTRTL
jgi:hypothetical protein